MDFNFLGQKNTQNKGKKAGKPAGWGGSIAGALLFFLLITGAYLLISGDGKVTPEVSISDLAKSVQAGDVKNITVEGDDLTITYQNNDIKDAKKEIGSALSQ